MNNHLLEKSDLLKLDHKLFNLVKDINILDAIAPKNFHSEKKSFFAHNGSVNPKFIYNKNNINVFSKKRALYNLPIESLPDTDLTELYGTIIESYTDKLDQYKSIGTDDFIYDSMRYYGEPNDKDLRNANFILHAPELSDDSIENSLEASDIVRHLSEFAKQHHYKFTIKIDEGMIANALVSGETVKINANAKVSKVELNALAHHELGVHLVTTLNAQAQPLKILALGSPVNTTTQEGLAILCEYLSGYLPLSRLKTLALRVIAVKSMLNERDFKRTFSLLKEQYQAPDNLAFTITARVYRGGGFTKDYLYLQGFHQILNAYEAEKDFNNLLAGKASIEQLPIITRLINKGYFVSPKFISPAISNPQPLDPIKQFLAHAIK